MIIEIGLGLLALNSVALYGLRRKSPAGVIPATSPPVTHAMHDPHIHIVERREGKPVIVETLRNGMLDPANHAKVGAVLASGHPDCGIQWHGGESNIEWAKEAGNA